MCYGEFISSFTACLGKIGHTMGSDSSGLVPVSKATSLANGSDQKIAEFLAAPFYEIQEGSCLVPYR